MTPHAPLPVQPAGREAYLEEDMEQPAEAPAVETTTEILEAPPEVSEEQPAEAPAVERATEIPKARPSPPSWFRDAGDVKRAVIWAEVLKRPVPRRSRRRHPHNRAGPV
ncbi:hypothetical protein MYX64_01040 [Nitrospinae bacterium AH_259_B05_G02_I21]|nr:hypothetical protein [Nitrospinae bacterium AH_259_B05_G02_I21]